MGLDGGDFSLDFASWLWALDGGGVAGFPAALFFLEAIGPAAGVYERTCFTTDIFTDHLFHQKQPI